MKPISPYSIEGMSRVINNHLLSEWRGMSKVKNKDNLMSFKDFINDVILLSIAQSELMFEIELITQVEKAKSKRIAKYYETNTKSKETAEITKLQDALTNQLKKNTTFDFVNFNAKIKEQLLEKYEGLNGLKPKYFEKINKENLIDKLFEIKETKRDRLQKFKGLPYKRSEFFHFVDAVSAPIVYYRNQEGDDFLNVLISGISSYVLKVNEIKNTKRILKKLKEIEEGLKIDSPKFNFDPFTELMAYERKYQKDQKLPKFNTTEKQEITSLLSEKK